MEIIQFNPQDPYFNGAGPVEDILKDPRITVTNIPPPNSVFNVSRPQQNFIYPVGTGTVRAKQFIVDNEEPILIPYVIPAAISSSLNIQNNANQDGFIAERAPTPLVGLTSKQAIIKVHVSAGIIQVDEWWVIQDSTLKPSVPSNSPAGGSFMNEDRKTLTDIYSLLTKVSKTLGL